MLHGIPSLDKSEVATAALEFIQLPGAVWPPT
jgi:hypothetical protein